ncbi:MAG: hypothetical protein ABIE07_08630, partial [Candidatus Zixiibacteriota bacterium]
LIWLHLLMIASSNSFALIITLQGNVWTFEPQLSYLEINCCTSNVNPPTRLRGYDKILSLYT